MLELGTVPPFIASAITHYSTYVKTSLGLRWLYTDRHHPCTIPRELTVID